MPRKRIRSQITGIAAVAQSVIREEWPSFCRRIRAKAFDTIDEKKVGVRLQTTDDLKNTFFYARFWRAEDLLCFQAESLAGDDEEEQMVEDYFREGYDAVRLKFFVDRAIKHYDEHYIEVLACSVYGIDLEAEASSEHAHAWFAQDGTNVNYLMSEKARDAFQIFYECNPDLIAPNVNAFAPNGNESEYRAALQERAERQVAYDDEDRHELLMRSQLPPRPHYYGHIGHHDDLGQRPPIFATRVSMAVRPKQTDEQLRQCDLFLSSQNILVATIRIDRETLQEFITRASEALELIDEDEYTERQPVDIPPRERLDYDDDDEPGGAGEDQ